jgi:predicted cupin superfamily sugar epimerase
MIALMSISAEVRGESKMTTAEEMIKKLDLKPLPEEGGYYRETYKSSDPTLPAKVFGIDSATTRRLSTAIYYLVTPESFSALHRVKSDEMFHFYSGDPVEMIQIDNSGNLTNFILGADVMNNQTPQVVVPKGIWQALRLKAGGKWALMGTTVAPGFEFEDFELGDRSRLIHQFPKLKTPVTEYTIAK